MEIAEIIDGMKNIKIIIAQKQIVKTMENLQITQIRAKNFSKGDSMETIIIVGMILFVLWLIIYSTGYMLEMILHPEEIAREYWEEK